MKSMTGLLVLGLKIFDACGDADLAERQLELLFPELRAADADCQINDEHSIIGLIDFIALTDYAHINQQLTWHSIPFVSIQLDDFLPADEVAQVGLNQLIDEINKITINRLNSFRTFYLIGLFGTWSN